MCDIVDPLYLDFQYRWSIFISRDGSYISVASLRVDDIARITSFNIVHRHVDGQEPSPSDQQVMDAEQTFILHFPDAGILDSRYLNIFTQFRARGLVGES